MHENGGDWVPLHVEKAFPALFRRHNFICIDNLLHKAPGAAHHILIPAVVGYIPSCVWSTSWYRSPWKHSRPVTALDGGEDTALLLYRSQVFTRLRPVVQHLFLLKPILRVCWCLTLYFTCQWSQLSHLAVSFVKCVQNACLQPTELRRNIPRICVAYIPNCIWGVLLVFPNRISSSSINLPLL